MFYVQDSQRRDVHRVLAEKALGKPLPKGAEVHHVDGNSRNNEPSNLVICPSRDYHMLLHRRQRASDLGYDLTTQGYCNECKQIKPKEDFYFKASVAEKITDKCRPCSSVRANFYGKRRRELRAFRELVVEGV